MDVSCHSSVLVGWGDRWMSAVTVTALCWLAGVTDGCQLSLSQLCAGWLGGWGMSAVTVTALCWLAGWLGDVSCHCHSSVLVVWLEG